MKLYIVRHGDPDYAADSLTERGQWEAELLAAEEIPAEEIPAAVILPPIRLPAAVTADLEYAMMVQGSSVSVMYTETVTGPAQKDDPERRWDGCSDASRYV